MKPPKNFYNTVDQRKLGLEDGLLPDVTAADNGKILKVTGGKWQPGSGAGTEVFTAAITYDAEQEEYSADKTHAQIVAAIAGGSIIMATYDGRTYVYAGSGKESAGSPIYFSYTQSDSESQMIEKVFEIDEDNRILLSEHNIAEELPVVDTADNGTMLSVSEGVWGKGYKIVDTITDARLKALVMKNNEISTCSQEVQFYSNTPATLDQDGFYHAIGYFAYMTNGIGVYTKLKHTDDVSILHADISTILRFTIGNITLDGVQTALSKSCLIGVNGYPSVTLYSIFNELWYEVLIDRKNNKAYSIGFDSHITEVSGNDYDYEIKFKLHALT